MHIPASLQHQRRWLLWREEDGRKVPYYATNHRRRNGVMDTEDDWQQLVEYEEAVRIFRGRSEYKGLGYAVTPGHVLIDLDDVIDDEGVIADEWAQTFISKAIQAKAFVEISHSGKGIHILGPGTGLKAGHKDVNIEVYTEKRFVCITGNMPTGAVCSEDVGDCSELAALAHAEHRQRSNARQLAHKDVIQVSAALPPAIDLLGLLQAFDPDDREQWVKIGLAFGRAFPDDQAAFDTYCQWSKTSRKYAGEKDDRGMHDIFYRQSTLPASSKYTLDTMLEQVSEMWPQRAVTELLTKLFGDQFTAIADSGNQRTVTFVWEQHALTLNELEHRPPQKRFIIEHVLPAARTAMIGRGGLGKTMLLLYEAVHVAAGRQLYGRHNILDQGRVLIITAEEERSLLVRRTASLLDRLPWSEAAKKSAFTNVAIQDVSSRVPRLIGQNKNGEFQVTPWTDKLIDGYRDADIKWVIFDPISAFGMNENAMNDSAVVIMEAATRMSDGLGGAAVTLVHHTSKEGARNNIVDAHSGRGGSAFGDASRATRVLTARMGLPTGQSAYDAETRTSRLTLHHVKNSYAAPVEALNIDIVDGYDVRIPEPVVVNEDDDFWVKVEKVIRQEETLAGHAPSIETVTRVGEFGMSRVAVRQRLMDGVAVGRLVLTDHPTDKRKRGISMVPDWNGF